MSPIYHYLGARRGHHTSMIKVYLCLPFTFQLASSDPTTPTDAQVDAEEECRKNPALHGFPTPKIDLKNHWCIQFDQQTWGETHPEINGCNVVSHGIAAKHTQCFTRNQCGQHFSGSQRPNNINQTNTNHDIQFYLTKQNQPFAKTSMFQICIF